jgi:hypothetical protein
MSLMRKIADLTARVAAELTTKATPGDVHAHPGVAKAWACFGLHHSRAQLFAGFNVATVERLDVGRYRVVFATAFAHPHYCWQAFARNSGQLQSIKLAIARVRGDAKTNTLLELSIVSASGTPVDSAEINLIVFA